MKVEQGQKVTVKLAGRVNGSDDGLKWCLGKAFVDWNLDYVFDGNSYRRISNGGRYVNAGTDSIATGCTFILNVPEMRQWVQVVSVWYSLMLRFTHPGPTGGCGKRILDRFRCGSNRIESRT